jgi:adenylylsulfate kinase-like enzyme
MKFEPGQFPGISAGDLLPPGHSTDQTKMRSTPAQPRNAIVIRGLPGIGKTTLANRIAEMSREGGQPTFHINADVVRAGISKDLGFSRGDRAVNAFRIGYLARMCHMNGLLPVVDFVMPTEDGYEAFKAGIGSDFFKVYTLQPTEDFKSRFADTQNIWEDGKRWYSSYESTTGVSGLRRNMRVFSIQPFRLEDLELIAISILQDSRR